MNISNLFQTADGNRWIAMIEYVNSESRERICYRIMDDMRKKRVMRSDRIIPEDAQADKIAWAYKDMNRSDGEWIEKIIEWKATIGLDNYAQIELSGYEQEWMEYLTGKIEAIPTEGELEAVPF